MKTRIELSKQEIEDIVEQHLRSSMSLYGSKATADTVWSSDGTALMTVTFEPEREDGDG